MLNDEDKKEFEEAMKNVRPLDSRHSVRPKIKKPIKIRSKTPPKDTPSPAPAYYVHPNQDHYGQTPWVGPEDEVEFNRSGLQQRAIQQLKRGQLPIERKVDLHGLTAEEALDLLHATLDNCQQENQRLLLVIHGKGHYSQGNTPILKNVLNQWLRQSPLVLAFHSALPKHGGNGAMYVLIKVKRQK